MGKWAETEEAYFGGSDTKEEKEIMKGRVLPILFNTDMVQAILDGRKTVTRRLVRYKYSNTELKMRTDKYGTRLIEIQKDIEGETHGRNPDGGTWHKLLPYIDKKPPYKKGNILYVRETWAFSICIICMNEGACNINPVEYDDGDSISEGCFLYRAECAPATHIWKPSIHMPKQAARIWLKVTDVRVERLQDMNTGDFLAEGVVIRPEAFNDPENAYWQARRKFVHIWDATVKKAEKDRYGWDANPWVWVIEFERCKKPVEE